MKYIHCLIIISVLILNSTSCSNTITKQGASKAQGSEIWYLKTEDKNVDLFVKEFGVGDTVVVVHGGFGAEHSYLLDPFLELNDDYHFVFYDQRGSLRSPAPDSLISISKHLEDIETLRRQLNISKLKLVGHSMGTYLCGAYLEKYPDKVESLTLLALIYPKTPDSEEEKDLFDQQQQAAVEFFKRPEINAELEKYDLNKDTLSDKEATYKWQIGFAAVNIYDISKWRIVKGGRVFYNQSAGTATGKTLPNETGWNFIDDYEKTGIPVTIINGSHDFADMGGLMYRNLLSGIPNIEYIMIDKAGHNAWIDQPKIFKEKLIKALKK